MKKQITPKYTNWPKNVPFALTQPKNKTQETKCPKTQEGQVKRNVWFLTLNYLVFNAWRY